MIRVVTNVALAALPVNALPLLDDTDFRSRKVAVAYNAAGMDLVWNFVTALGAFTQTAVTPTTAGVHDWTHKGDGMYSIGMPKTGGTVNNTSVGVGWFSGLATGVLPWSGPQIEFVLGGEITSGTPSTTSFICSAFTGVNADQFKNVYVTFHSGTCARATVKITALSVAAGTFTVEALPAAPSVADVFEIVNGA